MSSAVGLRSERGPVLLAVMMATALVAIAVTVPATAVPTIVDDIGGSSQYPWLFSIYLLAQSVTVPVYSKLSDTFGRKPIVLFGIGLFIVASVLCSFAWDMGSLIVFRGIQGLGAGAILPVTITILGDIYSVEERSRVQGYIAAVWGSAAVLGPTIGGAFAQLGYWPGIFLVNVPLGLLAAVLLIRGYHERVERREHRIDFGGAIVLTLALALLILGVLEGGHSWPWWSWITLAVFGGGAVLLALFVVIERRVREPVLSLELLGRRVVWSTVLVGLMIGIVTIGLSAFVPNYLERSIGLPPLLAGLALATLSLGWPLASLFAGRLYLRWGFRLTVFFGGLLSVIGAVALALLAFLLPPHPLLVAACGLVIGLGLGFSAVPGLVAVQSSVQWNERGVATGLTMFSRSIGQAIGAAVLGAVFNGVLMTVSGGEQTPAGVISGTTAVFAVIALGAIVLAALALAMPRDTPDQARSAKRPDPTETGPIATASE